MAFTIANFPLPGFKIQYQDYYIKWNTDDYDILEGNNEFLLVEGFLWDINKSQKLNIEEILPLINEVCENHRTLPEWISGQFNIIYLTSKSLLFFNDFIGIKPLYYSLSKDKIVISNSIFVFSDLGFRIDDFSILESFIPGKFAPFNNRTYFQDVKRVRSGEHIKVDLNTLEPTTFLDAIQIDNKKIDKDEVKEISDAIVENSSIYSALFETLIMAQSGGIDSRITISSFKDLSKIRTLSYGEKDYIDCIIARKISDHLNIGHDVVSFKDHLFPTEQEFEDQKKFGAEIYANQWYSVFNFLKRNNLVGTKTSIIQGDHLDILRAHNIRSVRSRKNRIKIQLGEFFGRPLKSPPLETKQFIREQIEENMRKINKILSQYPQLKNYFHYDEQEFRHRVTMDISDFVEFLIKKASPQNQFNLEELFYIFSWGVPVMGKQSLIFKGRLLSYTMMSSRHLSKKLLNYDPVQRFEEKLTSKLLNTNNLNQLRDFPTSQIPFVPFKTNLYIKYLVWAYRSMNDQVRLKKGKERLVKHVEWKKYYQNPRNKELLENFLKDVKLNEIPLGIFNKRASGELWPLIETDIMVFAYLLKLKSEAERG